jgi:nucleotide-binding universal stress UspA family protein
MKPFKRILLLYSRDTCDQAVLDLALYLAQDCEAQVTIVDVIEGLPSDVRRTIAIMRPLFLEQPEEPLVREETERLVQSVRLLREHGIQGDTKVLVGTPCREIIGEILQNNYDLIILSADREGNLRERLFHSSVISGWFDGNTVEKVLRRARCPVLIVQPTEYCAARPIDPAQVRAAKNVP